MMESKSLYDDENVIADAAVRLHSTIAEFVNSLAFEHINYRDESAKQHAATDAVKNFEKICHAALAACDANEDKNVAVKMRSTVEEARDKSSVAIITYQRAMLKYNRRKAEYGKCNPLTRGIISPRATPADIWREPGGDEEKDENAEMSCMLVAVISFLLFGIAYVLSSYSVPRTLPQGQNASPFRASMQKMQEQFGREVLPPSDDMGTALSRYCDAVSTIKDVEGLEKIEL